MDDHRRGDSVVWPRYRARMLAVRRFLAQRNLAAMLCAATLLLKLVVPAGYMIGTTHGRVAIELCSGIATPPGAMTMAMAMPGMPDGMPDHGKSPDHGKAEMPCAFSGLAAAALGSGDPVQLAVPIAFAMAAGLPVALLPAIVRRGYLRPPLRGPPAVR